jgi:hypothetical protein
MYTRRQVKPLNLSLKQLEIVAFFYLEYQNIVLSCNVIKYTYEKVNTEYLPVLAHIIGDSEFLSCCNDVRVDRGYNNSYRARS